MTHNSGIAMSKGADIIVSSKAGTVCGGVRSITISEGAGISVSGKAGTVYGGVRGITISEGADKDCVK